MKLIDAQTLEPIPFTKESLMLCQEYATVWQERYGRQPLGWHPIPSGVPQDDVQMFIAFSARQE
jgi:hypothetical protein